jgi:hypothetical protein
MNKSVHYNIYLFGFIFITNLFTETPSAIKPVLCPKHIQSTDSIPPIAKCLTNISSYFTPQNYSIVIHAKDFDNGSFDNLTSSDKLKFYFDGEPFKDSIRFTCFDLVLIGEYEMKLDVAVWVEDESGNSDHCLASIIIEDRLDICNVHRVRYKVDGEIRTENGYSVKTNVTFVDTSKINTITSSGYFLFGDLNPGSFTLCLERNHDHLNGVSTSDVVKIRRHILGIEELNSPYKLMAADVNRSGTITAADIAEIRKLIQGNNSKFTKVPSWIFVPKNKVFVPNVVPDINQFIPSCDSFEIKDKNIENVDYIGIKMGDVNGNAQVD